MTPQTNDSFTQQRLAETRGMTLGTFLVYLFSSLIGVLLITYIVYWLSSHRFECFRRWRTQRRIKRDLQCILNNTDKFPTFLFDPTHTNHLHPDQERLNVMEDEIARTITTIQLPDLSTNVQRNSYSHTTLTSPPPLTENRDIHPISENSYLCHNNENGYTQNSNTFDNCPVAIPLSPHLNNSLQFYNRTTTESSMKGSPIEDLSINRNDKLQYDSSQLLHSSITTTTITTSQKLHDSGKDKSDEILTDLELPSTTSLPVDNMIISTSLPTLTDSTRLIDTHLFNTNNNNPILTTISTPQTTIIIPQNNPSQHSIQDPSGIPPQINMRGAMSTTHTTCSICLDDYEAGDEIRELPCSHDFHGGCIRPWFERALNERLIICPVCRSTWLVPQRSRRNSFSLAILRNNYHNHRHPHTRNTTHIESNSTLSSNNHRRNRHHTTREMRLSNSHQRRHSFPNIASITPAHFNSRHPPLPFTQPYNDNVDLEANRDQINAHRLSVSSFNRLSNRFSALTTAPSRSNAIRRASQLFHGTPWHRHPELPLTTTSFYSTENTFTHSQRPLLLPPNVAMTSSNYAIPLYHVSRRSTTANDTSTHQLHTTLVYNSSLQPPDSTKPTDIS